MNHTEKDAIVNSLSGNFELRKLYQQHIDLEEVLDTYTSRLYLSSSEEVKVKELKHKKLQVMERMLFLVAK